MYIGRVGPLTIGISLFSSNNTIKKYKKEDIAT